MRLFLVLSFATVVLGQNGIRNQQQMFVPPGVGNQGGPYYPGQNGQYPQQYPGQFPQQQNPDQYQFPYGYPYGQIQYPYNFGPYPGVQPIVKEEIDIIKPIGYNPIEAGVAANNYINKGHSEKYFYGRSGLDPEPNNKNKARKDPTPKRQPDKRARYYNPILDNYQQQYQQQYPINYPYNNNNNYFNSDFNGYMGGGVPIDPFLGGVRRPVEIVEEIRTKNKPFNVEKRPHYEVYLYE